MENPLPYMKNAKLFVSFSNYEGQPNAVIQSIGCGTKTVLKNYPGIPSIIKKSKQVKIIYNNNIENTAMSLLNFMDEKKNNNFNKKFIHDFDVKRCTKKISKLFYE